ncbi:hypothetical protein ECPA3_0770, partial [Escherichia coli PA3]
MVLQRRPCSPPSRHRL